MNGIIVKTKKGLLIGGDLVILYFSLWLTLALRFGLSGSSNQFESHFWPFSFVFFFWLIIFFISELYDIKISYNNFSLANILARTLLISGLIAILIFYFLGPLFENTIKPQRVLIIDLAITGVLIFFWRKLFYTTIKSEKIANNALIMANNPLAHELIEEIRNRPQLGFKAITTNAFPDNLRLFCETNKIDLLVVSSEMKNDSESAKKIFDCLSLGIDIYSLNGFYEQVTGKVPVKDIEHSWFLENLTENSKKFYEVIKRVMDIILAIIGLAISLFIAPIVALIIRMESSGPIIFKQIRTGKNGKTFLALKFRSMINDAEKNGAQWAEKNDPRVTKFGRIMRKTRLDEIPQLINILKGDMSFVGPRPERPEFIEILAQDIPFYKERLLVKPGLTGWAQLNGPAYGGSKEESLEKLKYDLFYIKNRSLFLDLSVILKTVKVIISRKGQ